MIFRKFSFIKWSWDAQTIDSVDSPFISNFYNEVIKKKEVRDGNNYPDSRADSLLLRSIEFFQPESILVMGNKSHSNLRSRAILETHLNKKDFSEPGSHSSNPNGTKIESLWVVYSKHSLSNIKLTQLLNKESPTLIFYGFENESKNEKDQIFALGNYNILIDMWYIGVMHSDHRIKEKLRIKLNPIPLRLKPGLFRR